ncbi:MAG: nitrate reductase, partial [Zoogloea sp.]|nr:nitrate reductase [Zoogloea sp.]
RAKRGEVVVKAMAARDLRPGQCFLPMHWGANSMGGGLGVNALMPSDFDPYSKQPELKHAVGQVEKFKDGKALVALRRQAPAASDAAGPAPLELMARLRTWMQRFPYASLTLAGRDAPVVVLKARGDELTPELLAELDHDLVLDDPARVLSYQDRRRDIAKRALVEGDILTGVRLAGETRATGWLTDLMVRSQPAGPVRPWLFAPLTQPPAGEQTRGKVVCNCFDVAEDDILKAFHAGESLDALQARTRCGTNCGSCLPELKRLAASVKS